METKFVFYLKNKLIFKLVWRCAEIFVLLFKDKFIPVNLNTVIFVWNLTWLCSALNVVTNHFRQMNVTNAPTNSGNPKLVAGGFEPQHPGRVKWAAGRSKVKLTDTLIETSDPFKPCGCLQPAISEEIQKKTKSIAVKPSWK